MANTAERVNTVVIGGGQAGLSVGYHLSRLGVEFVILDASPRIGDWRNRWESLRLFTPARHAGLDGLPFPDRCYYSRPRTKWATTSRPTRDIRAAGRLGRPRRTAVAARRRFLVVLTAAATTRQRGRRDGQLPGAASATVRAGPRPGDHPAAFVRLPHAVTAPAGRRARRRRRQLGCRDRARSGSEPSHLAGGPKTGHVPYRIEGLPARLLLTRLLLRVVFHRVLTIATPIGRKLRPKMLRGGAPLVRTRPKELTAAGVGESRGLSGSGTASRCSRTGACSTSRTSSGAPGSHPGSRGSTCRCSTLTETAPRGRFRGRRAWALLRRAALPVRVLVRNDPRSGQGRRSVATFVSERSAAADRPAQRAPAA